MKPFITGCELPMTAPEIHHVASVRLTYQDQVLAAMSSGAWFSRKSLEQATGLTADSVNTVLQHGLRRGSMERELPLLRGCTKAVTQRYRMRGKR